jgi:hypothetical protein
LLAPFRDDAKAKQLTMRHETHYLPAKPISQPPILTGKSDRPPAERWAGPRNRIHIDQGLGR